MNGETERSLSKLRDKAIRTCTEAARVRIDGDHESDMADFIASVLSATAANLGGLEFLVAGRPGSWEADLVRQLVTGTVGYDPYCWQIYRTEPIKVTLNVAELIEASDLHRGLFGLTDAADHACYRLLAELGDTPETDDRMDQATRALESRDSTAYRDYGVRFQTVAAALAAEMRLPAVEVELDVDPKSCWWEDSAIRNPDSWGDPIIDDLWQRAHDVTRLPDILIAPISKIAEGGDNHGDI